MDENGEWRRLRNEELHSLYRSPNIVWVIKSRRLRWAGHVARMEEGRSAFKILTCKPTGKRPLIEIHRFSQKKVGYFSNIAAHIYETNTTVIMSDMNLN